MPRPIVFVDTNKVENKGSATFFFGGRSELEKIAKRADIAVPRIVYDELCKHITSYLERQRMSFKKNPYRYLLDINENGIDTISHNELINKLTETEIISHEVIDLEDEIRAYREIYAHAVQGTAPFESKGDKGFKDALIAKTIDQYIELHSDRMVFLLTGDVRLREYFANNETVILIEDFADFDREYSEDKVEDKALIDRLWDYFDEVEVVLSKRRVPDDQWLNYEGDIVVFFEDDTHGDVYALVDSIAREPISFMGESLQAVVKNLEEVGSFQGAHTAIAEADYILAYCSVDHVKTIAQVILTNDQIYGIGGDDDIAQFAAKLFHILDDNGESALADEIKTLFDLKLQTKKQLDTHNSSQ